MLLVALEISRYRINRLRFYFNTEENMDITSPPYPRVGCNTDGLYSLLLSLGDWVEEHREWAEAKAEEANAPFKPFLPDLSFLKQQKLERFKTLAIACLASNCNAMQEIRTAYDHIVRNNEEVEQWESPNCVFLRLTLLRKASLLLTAAFLDKEKREARCKEIRDSVGGEVRVVPVESLPPGLLEKIFPARQEGISDAEFDNLFNSNDLLEGDNG